MVMIPFLSFSMAGIFTGKYFRTFTVVVVIAGALSQKPAFRTIEMFVHQINFQTFHFRPQIIKIFSFGIRTGATYYFDFRVSFTNGFDKRFETFGIFFPPLFVTDTDKLQVKRSRMSHIGTYFSPRSIHVSISKLNQVECILNIVIQITNCYVSFRIIILILAGKSAIQNRQRCRTHFFRQQEIFVESQSIALIIIREESVSKSILPTIFI